MNHSVYCYLLYGEIRVKSKLKYGNANAALELIKCLEVAKEQTLALKKCNFIVVTVYYHYYEYESYITLRGLWDLGRYILMQHGKYM